jgi:hypothetical protein
MSTKQINRLNAIFNSSVIISDEIAMMRTDMKRGLTKLETATKEIRSKKDHGSGETGAWRIVPHVSEADRFPLVKSDLDHLRKKLDII